MTHLQKLAEISERNLPARGRFRALSRQSADDGRNGRADVGVARPLSERPASEGRAAIPSGPVADAARRRRHRDYAAPAGRGGSRP